MSALSLETPRRARLGLAAGAALVAAWPLAMSYFRRGDIYAVMGPFAIGVITLVALLGRARAPRVDRAFVGRQVVIGVVVGIVMTVLTYAAYAVAVRLVPELAPRVHDLYRASRTEHPAAALSWTVIIVVAEESLWRGWLLDPLAAWLGRGAAFGLSLATYAAAQTGSGSGIVTIAAVVCGAIWLTERFLTGSIIAPLVSHLIWTPVVIHLLPLG